MWIRNYSLTFTNLVFETLPSNKLQYVSVRRFRLVKLWFVLIFAHHSCAMDHSLENTSSQAFNFSIEDCSFPLAHGVALITINSIVGVFREEQCLRDICVTFTSLLCLILHFFFSLIDYID